MKNSRQPAKSPEAAYRARYDSTLTRIAEALRHHIAEIFQKEPRIDRITARAKDVKSFLKKANTRIGSKNGLKYSEPLAQIQDQIGARIVAFYRSDVERIDAIVRQYFTAI
jgi:putative GTP pyrophosphokinase